MASNIAPDWADIEPMDLPSKLDYLLLVLQNLPKSIPDTKGIYVFDHFAPDAATIEQTGSYQGAVLDALETAFGDYDDTVPVAFFGRGQGLEAVVEILRMSTSDDTTPQNSALRAWVDLLLRSAFERYQQEQKDPVSIQAHPFWSYNG